LRDNFGGDDYVVVMIMKVAVVVVEVLVMVPLAVCNW
jgi:hypothetical protein